MRLLFIAGCYFLLIPIFAGVYSAIPGGFYAPYAKLERSGVDDAYAISQIFKTAIARRIVEVEQGRDANAEWHWDRSMVNVSFFDTPDPRTFTFHLLAGFHRVPDNGLNQIAMEVKTSTTSVALVHEGYPSDMVTKNEWYLDVVPNMTGFGPLPDYTKTPLSEGPKELATIVVTDEEVARIDKFIQGISGDPTALSGGFWRLLYFSTMVITTVGFGDIVPMDGLTRFLVGSEAILGIIIAGFFVNIVATRRDRGPL